MRPEWSDYRFERAALGLTRCLWGLIFGLRELMLGLRGLTLGWRGLILGFRGLSFGPERTDYGPERGRGGDGRTYGRTSGNSPLCPTGHRPFGAAAQKGKKKAERRRNPEENSGISHQDSYHISITL